MPPGATDSSASKIALRRGPVHSHSEVRFWQTTSAPPYPLGMTHVPHAPGRPDTSLNGRTSSASGVMTWLKSLALHPPGNTSLACRSLEATFSSLNESTRTFLMIAASGNFLASASNAATSARTGRASSRGRSAEVTSFVRSASSQYAKTAPP